ncbi:hypothetical protein [Hyalangium versicolor]|uniref:hypothetical protein n=1 Tax=Hyalangium versicolor TaxID=2861190 RepID=UPI001CCB2D71|nr:hypothetical protein [Hyalangium versicolor]
MPTLRAQRSGIAVGRDTVVVAWSEHSKTEQSSRVYVSEYRDGVWKQVGEPFSGVPDHSVLEVSVAMDEQGNPHVAWTEESDLRDEGVIYYSRCWFGSGWTPPELIQPRGVLYGFSQPQIVVDSTGEPWVAWDRMGGPPYSQEIYYRRHRSSGWEPEQFVSGGVLSDFHVNRRGFPFVAVQQGAVLQPQ